MVVGMMLAQKDITAFQKMIWEYYHVNKRRMPWREVITPYHVVISEIMLQQTQVLRVMQKFPSFIAQFPNFEALAQVALVDVLEQWQGMGYNRRAKYLKRIAEIVVGQFDGQLPDDPTILQTFPGLGYATANSIVAFAYNKPVVFIETNIRRIFIHHFFADREGVHDKEIMPVVSATLDVSNPREWYYALMDYGTMLAKQIPNPNRKSKHYAKQSTFVGSTRQLRGEILRRLLQQEAVTPDMVRNLPMAEGHDVYAIFETLEREGFIVKDEGKDVYRVK